MIEEVGWVGTVGVQQVPATGFTGCGKQDAAIGCSEMGVGICIGIEIGVAVVMTTVTGTSKNGGYIGDIQRGWGRGPRKKRMKETT